MKTEKFNKLTFQDLKKSDLKGVANKMEDSSDSDYDSNYYSDTSIIQKIHRYSGSSLKPKIYFSSNFTWNLIQSGKNGH